MEYYVERTELRNKKTSQTKENAMLIKMKESKGFTLVELMIVVAIIGILAAVAVPFYQRYVQKAKLTSLVFPAVHSVETNIAAYFAVAGTFGGLNFTAMTKDSDLKCIDQSSASTFGYDPTTRRLVFTVSSNSTPTTGCPELGTLAGRTFAAIPNVTADGRKITGWAVSGGLADELGLK